MSEHQDSTLFIGDVVASELNEVKTGQVYDRAAYYGEPAKETGSMLP
jgi:hypothetical protein